MDISEGLPAIHAAAEALKNWGRWGDDDQVGTLNHIRPEDVVAAATLVKRGAVFAMGIPLLCALAADPVRVFTKEELLRDVWGFRSMGRTRTLDSHASRLRRKG